MKIPLVFEDSCKKSYDGCNGLIEVNKVIPYCHIVHSRNNVVELFGKWVSVDMRLDEEKISRKSEKSEKMYADDINFSSKHKKIGKIFDGNFLKSKIS